MMLLAWGGVSLLAAAFATGAWGSLAGFAAGAAVLLSPTLWSRASGPGRPTPRARERVVELDRRSFRRLA